MTCTKCTKELNVGAIFELCADCMAGETMALLTWCAKCDKNFLSTGGQMLCEECSGSSSYRRKEKERWDALTIDQKLDELKERLDDVVKRQAWDGRIG